jgi:Ca2+-binding EF-hand superfamily protein
VFLAATQFVASGFAAGDAPDAPADRDAEIIRRYDTNHDGKLDEAEIAAVKEQSLMANQEKRAEKRDRVKERLKEFDANADGQLDAQERAAMDVTLRERLEKRPRLLKRFDTDGDGKLSDAEWAAGRDQIVERLQK